MKQKHTKYTQININESIHSEMGKDHFKNSLAFQNLQFMNKS